MSQPDSQFKLRDLAHAAVLLILVPVVFYGGYKLVSHSADTEPEKKSLGTQASETIKEKVGSFLEDPGPPPGEAWIAAIDRLEKKLSSVSSADSDTIVQANRLSKQLALFRKHCETYINEVHADIDGDTHLGRTLMRLANEIDWLGQQSQQRTATHDWKVEFDASESERRMQQAMSMNAAFERQAAPIRRTHATTLASMTRRNRELADELQRTLDSIEKIERDTREQLARRRRSEAYAKDRAEIASLLKPFTSPGYYQLGDTPNDWRKKAEKKPLSYRTLDRIGALTPDIDGVKALATIGGMPISLHSKSARPMGTFPKYHAWVLSDEKNMQAIKRAQQLLKEHSVYLIEAGLLQP